MTVCLWYRETYKTHKKHENYCANSRNDKKAKKHSHLMLTFSMLSFKIKCERVN